MSHDGAVQAAARGARRPPGARDPMITEMSDDDTSPWTYFLSFG